MNVEPIRSISPGRRRLRTSASVAVNITLPPLLYEKMLEVIQVHGFGGPSDYFQSCVRAHAGLGLSPNAPKEIQPTLLHEQESR